MVAGGAERAPVGTWTVLFTDQVGSTDMRVRLGEEAFDAIRADLDARVAAALTAHGVVVTKSTGDGAMGGFGSTAAALRCAVAIQQAVADRWRAAGTAAGTGAPASEAVALRIGISVGDAVVENGDLQGTAVVEAARLCAAASGGTILCAEAVRVVSANRSGCTFGPVRHMALKGLPGPVAVHEVTWAPLPYEPTARRLSFRVLGPLEVLDDDRPVSLGGPKERLVLAVLLARVNSPVSVDGLIDAVWGDRPPRAAERTVHAYVARLRRALEPRRPRGEPSTLLVTVGRSYELRLDAPQLDASRFENLARRGTDQLGRGDEAAAATLREALELWRGDAFGEFGDVEACAAEARRLTELRLGLVEDRVDADLAAGRAAELVGEIETLLRDEPFRERRWGQLVVALYRSGRQRDALEAYQRARRLLADELGLEPGPELRRLEAAVLAQDPSLDVLRPAPAAAAGGLPAALTAVGPAFLGRESELDRLRGAWETAVEGQGGFVSVLGPEGIGKTRLVAELAHEVHREGAVVLYGRCDHAHRGARALLGQALQSAGASLAHLDWGAGTDAGDIAQGVARYLPTWAGGRPVLVVLDDLHVADAETLEVVADLAGWCQAAAMLVIGAFRVDATPPTGAVDHPPGAAQLALGPLSGDDVRRICDLYATEPWSAQDVERVVELTGGVPLLVHEHASEWARERADHRMAEAGDRVAVTRRRLIASRGEIAEGVEGIQQLLEQRRAQLAGREARLQETRVAALGGCPYKGLARFEAADAANFFGRERLVAELIARLAESRLLAVVGPSGSGKSSLVRAGLLPALAGGMLPGGRPWRSVIVCPGPHPARELALRLTDQRPVGGPRVVFVDQFEETFTAGADRTEQEEFIGRLLALTGQPDTAVVLAVRADHLGRCATFPELADGLAGNDVLVSPLRESELRRAVELPARRAGLEVQDGLFEVIVADVAGRAGALPLLSTALAETWERREGRLLTLAGYQAAGGVDRALARMAEDAYAALPAGPRAGARRLLLRLCDAGDEGDLSLRRRLPVADAADEHDDDARAALETLAARRLLTIDRDAVEVAHEALLREWPRLRGWLDEDVQGRRLHRRLYDATRSWERSGRDPSELYRGTRLGAAADWAAGHDDDLSDAERAFLTASQAHSEQELAQARRQATERARANRRLRALLAGVAVLLVAALIAGVTAFRQRDRAQESAADAAASATVAEARRLGTQALSVEYLDVSLLLAVEGRRLQDSNETRANLLAALTRSPMAMQVVRTTDTRPLALVVTSDGRHIAMGDNTGGIFFFDAATLDRVAEVVDETMFVDALVPLPGGRGVAAAIRSADTGEAAIRFFDPATGRETRDPLQPVVPPIASMDISDDGRYLAAATPCCGDGLAFETVWDLEAPGSPPRRLDHGIDSPSVAFAPDGRLLIASRGSVPGVGVTVVDPATGDVLLIDSQAHAPIALSPDGTTLVVTLGDESNPELAVIDMATGTRRQRLTGHTALITGVRFSPDGRSFASASRDRTVMLWNPSTGERIALLEGHNGWVNGVDYAADASTLYSASLDGVMIAWDLAGDRRFLRQLAAPGRPRCTYLADCPTSVSPSPDGTTLSYRYGGRIGVDSLAVRDLSTLRFSTETSSGHPNIDQSAWTPDGRHIVTVGDDKMIRLWDPATGHELAEQPLLLDSTSTSIASRRGDDAIYVGLQVGHRPGPHPAGGVGGHDAGAIVRLDPDTLQPLGDPLPVDRFVAQVGVSPDGRMYAVALDYPPGLQLVDSETGDVLAAVDGLDATYQVTFSPDGSLLAAGGRDGHLTLIDPATGRRVGPTVRAVDGTMLSLDFSPDGTQVVTGGSDGTVALWDTAATERIGRITFGSRNAAVYAWFGDDGRRITIADQQGGVWTLPSDPDEWQGDACEIAGRNLTRDEWRELIPDRPYHRTCPRYPAGP